MQFFIAVLMTIFSVCSNLLGSENTLRTELSKEESYDLINFYELNPWEKIEEYQHEKNISFDARLNTDSFCRPLDIALHEDKFDIAYKLIDEKKVDVLYKSPDSGYTPIQRLFLTCLVRHSGYDCDTKSCINLFKNLVKKGVDINSLSENDLPVLHMGLLSNQKRATLCIENGAKLMIKEGDKRWNFLTLKCLGDLEDLLNMKSELPSFYNKDRRIKDVLYTKFKYDYKNYCTWKECFTLALLFNRLKKEKKVVMPKVLIKYMTTFIAPKGIIYTSSPVEHIEETLEDAWSQQPSIPSNNIKNFEKEFQATYVDLMCHIIPKTWKNAWHDYKGGDRSEFNLIARALKYDGPK